MTLSPQDELYQQVILEHNKKPRNFKTPLQGQFTHDAEGYNPLCGDHYHVYLSVNERGLIEDVCFSGQGCAISKSSASLMTSFLKGRAMTAVTEDVKAFQHVVTAKELSGEQKNTLGKLLVFAGVAQYPSRVKCAMLSWYAAKAALDKQTKISTE